MQTPRVRFPGREHWSCHAGSSGQTPAYGPWDRAGGGRKCLTVMQRLLCVLLPRALLQGCIGTADNHRRRGRYPQYANYWPPLTRKRRILPHSAQPRHTNHWAPRTRKQHQQEHRPQRLTESNDPTQHAKGRTGDCPGPHKETTTRRNVTQGRYPRPPWTQISSWEKMRFTRENIDLGHGWYTNQATKALLILVCQAAHKYVEQATKSRHPPPPAPPLF